MRSRDDTALEKATTSAILEYRSSLYHTSDDCATRGVRVGGMTPLRRDMSMTVRLLHSLSVSSYKEYWRAERRPLCGDPLRGVVHLALLV